MSSYRNFVDDFPRRCRDLLDFTEGPARLRGREVALMLMVAASGMVVPYERLRDDARFDHPADDRGSYPEAAADFDALLEQDFLTSDLWNRPVGSWSMGNLRSVSGYPDGWPELQRLPQFPPRAPVRDVIYTMRNGLVHGNTYTREDPRGQIAALVFVCNETVERRKWHGCYRFLHVSPGDIKIFLNNWFAFIDRLGIPQTVASQILQKAA